MTQLAQRLRVGPGELRQGIGGPWAVAQRVPEREMERPGTLFVGRAGPSVGLLVSDDVDPVVTVGRPVGEWYDPATLHWSLDDVVAELRTPHRGAADAAVDAFLVMLRDAVESAFDDARAGLVVCRFCGRLVGPEFALADDCCYACGSDVLGIVY